LTVAAQTLNGDTMAATIGVFNGSAYAPVALTGSSTTAAAVNGLGGPGRNAKSWVSLTWANDPRNANNVTGLTLAWVEEGKATGGGTAVFAPSSTGTTVVGLTRGLKYVFSLVANSPVKNSNATTGQVVAQ
jgi:hypothetical protein